MNVRIDALVEQANAFSPGEREILISALQATLDPPDPRWGAARLKKCEELVEAQERREAQVEDADRVMAQMRSRVALRGR